MSNPKYKCQDVFLWLRKLTGTSWQFNWDAPGLPHKYYDTTQASEFKDWRKYITVSVILFLKLFLRLQEILKAYISSIYQDVDS